MIGTAGKHEMPPAAPTGRRVAIPVDESRA
jgi:hypothetical protein